VPSTSLRPRITRRLSAVAQCAKPDPFVSVPRLGWQANTTPVSTSLERDDASAERVGLCGSCRLAEIVISSRGSTFYLCSLSAKDPAFPRYPVLPVRFCRGYAPASSP